MNKKTMIKPIKKVIVASIGAIVSISSLSAFADNSDSKDNKDSDGTSSLCFHIDETPHHPDPAGSYVAIRMKNTSALKLDGKPLKLKEARGIAIGRAPILVGTPSWGDWVGNPMTGTCHKHDDEIQCGFQSISAITTPFWTPLGIFTSIETGSGYLTLVHNLIDKTTVMSQIGSVDVAYYDGAGDPIPDNSVPFPIFKKIKDIITDAETVDCKDVPHPEIPPFYIPTP